jgi:probable F420-dependent oxidoreductase
MRLLGLGRAGRVGGVHLSVFLFGLELQDYAPLIEAAEAHGYWGVWLGDHLVAPEHPVSDNPYSSNGRPGLDPLTPLADVWTVMAHAARSTSTIRLATGVYILALRNVVVTARSAASVQTLSDGRLVLGIGTGWLREEFAAVHESFSTRSARTDEMIDALRLLWTGDAVSYAGSQVAFDDIRLSPGVAIPIPIIAGGLAPRALDRAARACDGWFGPSCSLEQSMVARDEIERRRQRSGRHGPFTYHVRPDVPVDESVLGRYRDAGFDHVTLSLKQLGVEASSNLERRVAALTEAADRFGIAGRDGVVAGADG